MSIIEIRDLVKTFGRTRALDHLTMDVQPGEVHGFLGPNGAGKSTTLRVLLGLLKADSGHATILGGDPWTDIESLHRRISYVPGDVALWPNLTGGEVIDLIGRMRGGLDEKRRKELVARFDLDPTKKARAYSKGNRQKVALISALASDAEVYLLDEPTSGLDPLMEAVFSDIARDLKNDGRTILLSSHILSEVEKLSDRISIIRAGVIVESATLDQMRAMHTTAVVADVRGPVAGLDTLAGVTDLVRQGNQVSFAVDSVNLGAAISVLSAAGVDSLSSEPASLEQLFLSKYEGGSK